MRPIEFARIIAGCEFQVPAAESSLCSRLSTAEQRVPRFHFNVYDGHSSPDREGSMLPDCQSARAEAIVLAAALIREEGRNERIGQDWRMEVTDATDLILFSLDFTIIEAAAFTRHR